MFSLTLWDKNFHLHLLKSSNILEITGNKECGVVFESKPFWFQTPRCCCYTKLCVIKGILFSFHSVIVQYMVQLQMTNMKLLFYGTQRQVKQHPVGLDSVQWEESTHHKLDDMRPSTARKVFKTCNLCTYCFLVTNILQSKPVCRPYAVLHSSRKYC